MPRNDRNRINLLKEMPFFCLTDFQLIWENESCRQLMIEKMHNNGFIEFIKNVDDYNDSKAYLDNYKYYDTDELDHIWRTENLIKIIHINARMLSKNRGKITGFLSSFDAQPNIIMLSEIGKEGIRYLNTTFTDYNFEYDVPITNLYGGVAILAEKNKYTLVAKDEYQMIKTCNCSNCQCENKWVEITSNNKTYIIGCIYRHPNGDINHFRQSLSRTLEIIPNKTVCILGGDLNINLIHIQNSEVSNYVTDLMTQGFFPKVFLPTPITDNTCTLIDHFFVKLPSKDDKTEIISGNIFTDITDHLPIFLGLKCIEKITNNKPFIRILNDRAIDLFKNKCQNHNWNGIHDYNHIDEKFNYFQDSLKSIFNESFPLVRKSRKRAKDKKWMTSSILKSIRHKDRLYNKTIRSPSIDNTNNYKRYKTLLETTLKAAEENYYQNLFNDTKTATIKLWTTLGSIINPAKVKKQKIYTIIVVAPLYVCVCVCVSVCMFVRELLRDQWCDQVHILGKEAPYT